MFFRLIKGWTPYTGKGKRTGTPGHYNYDYDDGQQLSLLAWGEKRAAKDREARAEQPSLELPPSRAREELLDTAGEKPSEAPPPKLPNVAPVIRDKTWFARHGHQGAPQKGEKGYKGPAPHTEHAEASRAILTRLRELIEGETNPEWAQAYQWHMQERELHGEHYDPEDPDLHGYTWDDLAMEAGLPPGADLTEMLGAAMETTDRWSGSDYGVSTARERKKAAKGKWVKKTTARVSRESGQVPEWAAAAVIEDELDDDRDQRIVNLSKQEVRDFIKTHHSAFEDWNYRGLVFAVGLKIGGRLSAVATANTVPGEDTTLELSRIASDATVPFASSRLGQRILTAMGKTGHFKRLVTYSLTNEKGTTYRAMEKQGMRPVVWSSRTGGKASATRKSDEFKIRWEAGPEAKPGDPTILPQLDRLHELNDALTAGIKHAQEHGVQMTPAQFTGWLKTHAVDTDTLQKLVAMRGKPARTGRLRGDKKRAALMAELVETMGGAVQ